MNNYRIPEIAKKYTEYDMIKTHTELPKFPDPRVRLLYAFLSEGSLSAGHSELYTLAAALVQVGTDTHDMIAEPESRALKETDRSRQLKVLAGDYFSSRFYHLLAQAGEIEMVALLSNEVCEVNRMKMSLYMRMKQFKITAEEYIRQTVNIKTQLFTLFSHKMDEDYSQMWPGLLEAVTRCEVIVQEIGRNETLSSGLHGWAYWHVLETGTVEEKKCLKEGKADSAKWRTLLIKYKVMPILAEMLREQIHQITLLLQQFHNGKLSNEISQIVERFSGNMAASAVEEY